MLTLYFLNKNLFLEEQQPPLVPAPILHLFHDVLSKNSGGYCFYTDTREEIYMEDQPDDSAGNFPVDKS